MKLGIDRAQPPEGICGEPLLSIGLLECLLPEFGAELEDSISGPVGQQNEEVSEIPPRLDVVETTRGDEGGEDAVPFTAVLTAQEEPVSASDNLAAQLELTKIVVDRQLAVVEKTAQRFPLIARITQRDKDRRLFYHQGPLGIAPLEKLVGDGFGSLQANLLLDVRRLVCNLTLYFKQLSDQPDGDHGPVRVGGQCIIKVSSTVGEAARLDSLRCIPEQLVIDDVCVGDNEAFVVPEHIVDRLAVVVPRVFVQHMFSICDAHEEMTPDTLLWGLDQDAGGISGDTVGIHGVFPHDVVDQPRELGGLFYPTAQSGASQHDLLPCEDALLSVERDVVGVLADNDVSQQAGSGQAFFYRFCGQRRSDDTRRVVSFARKLGADDLYADQCRGPPLQGFGDIFADFLEGVRIRLYLGWNRQFDALDRQVLWKGLTTAAFFPLPRCFFAAAIGYRGGLFFLERLKGFRGFKETEGQLLISDAL